MKQTTKLRYKEHTKLRYKERYYHLFKEKGKSLSDEDYIELCNICKNNEGIIIPTIKKTKHINKKIVVFKEKYIICVYDNKNEIIRTVLFLNQKLKEKYKL